MEIKELIKALHTKPTLKFKGNEVDIYDILEMDDVSLDELYRTLWIELQKNSISLFDNVCETEDVDVLNIWIEVLKAEAEYRVMLRKRKELLREKEKLEKMLKEKMYENMSPEELERKLKEIEEMLKSL